MRGRVDGHKFEDEFQRTIEPETIFLRLHTPNTKYSGLTQPADFVVIGRTFSYVETKETASEAFSIAGMEQLPEIKDFVAKKRINSYELVKHSNYYVIVHFIRQKDIAVITAEYALDLLSQRKQLRYTDPNAMHFKSLKELKEAQIF